MIGPSIRGMDQGKLVRTAVDSFRAVKPPPDSLARALLLFILFAWCLRCELAAAQEVEFPEPSPSAAPEESDWKIQVGVIGGYSPEYDGSDEYGYFVKPKGSIAWRDRIILTESSLRAQFREGPFRFGPIVKYEQGRSDEDDKDIKGVGSVPAGFGVGLYIKYKEDGFALSAETRKELAGGHGGILTELKAELELPTGGSPWGKLGTELTIADSAYMEEFFGIDANQSARSGLPTFDADGGLRSISVFWASKIDLTPHWALGGQVTYLRMLGDAADSPIVEDAGSPNNVILALALVYRF